MINYLNKEEIKKKKKIGQSTTVMLNSYKKTGFIPKDMTKASEKRVYDYIEGEVEDLWKECCKRKWGKALSGDEIDRKYYNVDLTQRWEVHHLIRRGHHLTKWDVNNGIVITQGVHYNLTDIDPDRFISWLQEKYPARFKWYIEMLPKSFEVTPKPNIFELLDLKKSLTNSLAELLSQTDF